MPNSLYESLVKKYLETEGYIVYNNLKLPKKEIDILAISPKKEAIVGEVKGTNLKRDMETTASKLNKEIIEKYLEENYGITKFRSIYFCWNMYNKGKQMKEYGKEVGFDDIITYPQVIRSLLEHVKNVRNNDKWFYDVNRTNTLLIEIIQDAFLFESPYLNKKDFEE